MDSQQIESLVEEVLNELNIGAAPASAPQPAAPPTGYEKLPSSPGFAPSPSAPQARIHSYMAEFPSVLEKQIASASAASFSDGVFDTVDQAVDAAEKAFYELSDLTLEQRGRIIQAIRDCALANKTDFAQRTMKETGMGRVAHKEKKFELVASKTPGIEILQPSCFTGDRGLTVDELAPFGVIGAVTPSTHPLPTMVNNAISFIAAGNTAVFNAHPSSTEVFAYGMRIFNHAIQAAGGPANLITCVRKPTIESGKALFNHPRIRLLLVTGGPGVVKEAMRAPKRAICAGPGNPPVVVDETADLYTAAESIITGGAFDNNILCIGEKEVFAVSTVADALIRELVSQGCLLLDKAQIEALAKVAFNLESGHPSVNRNLVGRDASVLARAIGVEVGYDPPLLIGETDFNHLFVQEEQMMPFIPIVRTRNVTEAINMAIEAEHGYGHTACIHSRNIQNMHEMAKRVNTTLFIKNGPSTASLGSGGEGYTSFSIASPTGEGCTTARTFTRMRRCTLVDYFRIV